MACRATDLHLCSATHLEVVHVDLEVVHVVFGHVQQSVQAEPWELLSAAAGAAGTQHSPQSGVSCMERLRQVPTLIISVGGCLTLLG